MGAGPWVGGVWVALGFGPSLPAPAESLSWSADGRYLVAAAGGELVRVDRGGRFVRVAVPGVEGLCASSDGSLALGVSADSFVAVEPELGRVSEVAPPENSGRPVSWTRGPYAELVVTRALAHAQLRRVGARPTDPDAAASVQFRELWHDPHAPLVYLDTGYGLEVRHAETGATLRALDPGLTGERFLGAARDPEGRLVLLFTEPGGARVWAPPDPVPPPLPGIDPGAALALSAAGGALAVGDADGVTVYRTHDLGRIEGVSTRSPVVAVSFAPTDDLLAVALADGSVRLHPVALGGLRTPVRRPTSAVDPGRVSPGDPLPPPRRPDRAWSLGGTASELAWTPSGTLSAQVGGRLVEIDPDTGAETPLGPDGTRAPHAWSADGRLVAASEAGWVVVDRKRAPRGVASGAPHHQLTWAGAMLVVDAGDGALQAFDPSTGAARGEAYPGAAGVGPIALSPDGGRLCVGGADPRVVDPVSGGTVHPLGGQWGGVVAAAWSPDGTRLATAGADATLLVWDTRSWEVERVIEGAGGRALAFSPDGGRLVSASWDGAVVAEVSTGEVVDRLAFAGLLSGLAWSERGIALVDRTGNLALWAP